MLMDRGRNDSGCRIEVCSQAGVPRLIFPQVVGDAAGRIALLERARPVLDVGLPGFLHFSPRSRDKLESVFDFRLGGRLRRCRCLRRSTGSASTLKLIQFALGFVRFAAETDGGAAKTEYRVQRQFRISGIAERFQGVQLKADDLGGKAEFIRRFGVVGGEHLTGGVACRGHDAIGSGEEKRGKAADDRVQNGLGDGSREGHGLGLR